VLLVSVLGCVLRVSLCPLSFLLFVMSTPARTKKWRSGYKKKRRPPRRGCVPGVSSGASSSAGGTLEVPTPIATASGKKLALASPAAGEGVVFSQAEQAGEHSEEAFNTTMVGGAVRKLAKCTHCSGSLDVKESLGLGHRYGVVTRVALFCSQ